VGTRDIQEPEILPEFSSTKTKVEIEAYGTDLGNIKEIGYTAGDFPKSGDLNYIGWHLTKWIAWIKQNLGFNTNEIVGTIKDYVRTPSIPDCTGTPEDEICPSMNSRINQKITNLENNVNENWFKITPEEFAALGDMYKNINSRINAKITNSFQKHLEFAIPGGEILPLDIIHSSGSRDDGGDKYSTLRFLHPGSIVMAKASSNTTLDWTDKVIESVTPDAYNFITCVGNGDTEVTGVKVLFGTTGTHGFLASTSDLSSKPTVHIFALKSESKPIAFVASTSSGINGSDEYRTKHSLEASDIVYARRIVSVKVADTKRRASSENSSYKFIRMNMIGNTATYDSTMRLRTSYDYDNDGLLLNFSTGQVDLGAVSPSIPSANFEFRVQGNFGDGVGAFIFVGAQTHLFYKNIADDTTMVSLQIFSFRDTAQTIALKDSTNGNPVQDADYKLQITGHIDTRVS